VDKVQVSGAVPSSLGSENQAWNCTKGSGFKSVRWRVPTLNWAARDGAWGSEGFSPGATVAVRWDVEWKECGTDEFGGHGLAGD
jgi:hypothetical protein